MSRTIIGRAACGCIQTAIVLDKRWAREVGNTVAQMLRDGLRIETIEEPFSMEQCTHDLEVPAKVQETLL